MRKSDVCSGSGIVIDRNPGRGGSRASFIRNCDVCGKRVKLSARGRIPQHAPQRPYCEARTNAQVFGASYASTTWTCQRYATTEVVDGNETHKACTQHAKHHPNGWN